MGSEPIVGPAEVTARDQQFGTLLRRPMRVQKSRSSSRGTRRRMFRILVVDDQRFVRNTLRSFLGHEPTWEVFDAESGQAALDSFGEIQPDVVVLDIAMEGMSGLETSRRIRQIAPTAHIIFMSSYYTVKEASSLSDLFGGRAFVPKAEIGRLLRSTIQGLLGKRKPIGPYRYEPASEDFASGWLGAQSSGGNATCQNAGLGSANCTPTRRRSL